MNEDIADWLKGYATATAAVGMSEDADKLLEAAEEIVRLRALLKSAEGHRDEAVSYGTYWEIVATSR